MPPKRNTAKNVSETPKKKQKKDVVHEIESKNQDEEIDVSDSKDISEPQGNGGDGDGGSIDEILGGIDIIEDVNDHETNDGETQDQGYAKNEIQENDNVESFSSDLVNAEKDTTQPEIQAEQPNATAEAKLPVKQAQNPKTTTPNPKLKTKQNAQPQIKKSTPQITKNLSSSDSVEPEKVKTQPRKLTQNLKATTPNPKLQTKQNAQPQIKKITTLTAKNPPSSDSVEPEKTTTQPEKQAEKPIATTPKANLQTRQSVQPQIKKSTTQTTKIAPATGSVKPEKATAQPEKQDEKPIATTPKAKLQAKESAEPEIRTTTQTTENVADNSTDDTDANINDIHTNEDEADAETNNDEADAETNNDEVDAETNNDKADAETNIDEANAEGNEFEADVETNNGEADAETNADEANAETNNDKADAETNKDVKDFSKDVTNNSNAETKTEEVEDSIQTAKAETPANDKKQKKKWSSCLRIMGIPPHVSPMHVRMFLQKTAGFTKYCWVTHSPDKTEYIAQFKLLPEATYVFNRIKGAFFKGNKVMVDYGSEETDEYVKQVQQNKNAGAATPSRGAKKRAMEKDEDGSLVSDPDTIVETKKFKKTQSTTDTNAEPNTSNNTTKDNVVNPFAGKRVFWKTRDVYNETYGLSKTFLDSLKIRLPLVKRVVVKDINQDITTDHYDNLKAIFGLAGTIVDMNLFSGVKGIKSLMIEYDHPVEAVQAISMFNNQKMCGCEIKVMPDFKSKGKYFPVGLESIGPGLGADGRPLSLVRHQVEIQPIKHALHGLKNQINADHQVAKGVFEYPEYNQSDEQTYMNTSQSDIPIKPFNKSKTGKQAETHFNPFNTQSNISNQAETPINPFNTQSNTSNQADALNTALAQQASALTQPNLLLAMLNAQLTQGQVVSNDWATLQAQYLNMAQNMVQTVPVMGQTVPVMGQTVPIANQNAIMDQNILQPGQNMGQNQPMFVPNAPTFNKHQPPPQHNSRFSDIPSHNPNKSEWNTNQSSNHNQKQGQFRPGAGQNPKPHFSSAPVSYKSSPLYIKEDFRQENTDDDSSKVKDTLIFNYLPQCVTAQLLSSKTRDVGEVLYCEFTGPGRALVRFKHSADAERCFKLFHKSKVDGQVIDVKFM